MQWGRHGQILDSLELEAGFLDRCLNIGIGEVFAGNSHATGFQIHINALCTNHFADLFSNARDAMLAGHALNKVVLGHLEKIPSASRASCLANPRSGNFR